MSRIQRKFIVLAIALTFWGNASARNKCSEDHVEYKNAGDAVYKAFDDLVNVTVTNSSMDKTPYMNKLNQKLTQFLQDSFTYCNPNQNITTESFRDYLKVIEFSISNATALLDLERTGAFKCILNQKTNIQQCVMDIVDQNITLHNSYSGLHAKSHLAFNTVTCPETEKVKTCVLGVIKNETLCDKTTDYVTSLFDFIKSNYCDKLIQPVVENASVKLTGHWNFFTMASLWIALVFYRS